MRIAFCGPAKSGKTTAAEHLKCKYGGVVLSFASRLKEDAYDYGWNGIKDERGRRFLQELGKVVRSYNPDYWVNNVRAQIEHGYAGERNENIFIDDLRFANEVDILRTLGFTIVYLEPHGLPDADAPWRRDASEQFDPLHADYRVRSEIGMLFSFRSALDSLVRVVEEDRAHALGG
jgi:hypothetical protein